MTEGTAHNRSNGALKSFIERAEHLQNDRENIATDMKELFAEAKGAGWNPTMIRKVMKLRKIPKADRAAEEAELQTYLDAMGE